MPFTQSLVTHRYLNADLTPASGEVCFTLEHAMTNGSVTLAPSTRVTSQLDSTGTLTQVLTSTQDAGTVPQSVPLPLWRVDERISGASTRTYTIQVPSGGASADLGTLMPFVTMPSPGGND